MNIGGSDDTAPATRNEFRDAAMSYVVANQEQAYQSDLVEYFLAEKDEQGEMELVFQDKPEAIEISRWTDQSTLTEDVYPTDINGKPGPLLFQKGRYTVTIDRASGEQTYAREALE